MKRPRIVVTRSDLPGTGVQQLGEIADVEIWPDDIGPDAMQLREFLSGAHGLLNMSQDVIDGALLSATPSLVAIGQASAGYDNLDIGALTQHHVQASNCPGVLMETTADFAWALILSASRRVVEADALVRRGEWTNVRFTDLLGQDVGQRTLGIIGYGQIGKAVARRGAGFGMRVIHTSPNTASDEVSTRVPLEQLLAEADVVSIHTALTDDTRHLIDARALAQMKPSAVLVNTSRGAVVDELALARALAAGEIFAAGLDVFADEPIGAEHPLCSLSNVVLAPHIGSASLATRGQMVDLAATNLIAALDGAPMPNSLTPAVTPRRPGE